MLDPETSIPIEDVNPIFDIKGGGSFSRQFTVPLELNQHIFPTVVNHHGRDVYKCVYHKPFRLYSGGEPLMQGIVDLDEEVEIEERDDGTHEIEISLCAKNQDLSELLDGVEAQDIPLKDRIPVGSEVHSLEGTVSGHYYLTPETVYTSKISIDLPPKVFSLNKYKPNMDGTGAWIDATNVSEPYPAKPYCNVEVCVQKREKQSDGSYKTLREYEVFGADRPNSGLCFYVQYFLDCLFAHIGVAYDNAALRAVEDLNRLAFFNTKCECDAQQTAFQLREEFDWPGEVAIREFSALFDKVTVEAKNSSPKGYLMVGSSLHEYIYSTRLKANVWTKYASPRNFPKEKAVDILNSIQEAFGIRFIFDSQRQRCKAVLVKDVMRKMNAVRHGAILHDVYHIDNDVRGVKMSYGQEGTDYNYNPDDDNSVVDVRLGYSKIRDERGIYDKRTFYDQQTGNMYRIKVDEDAKTVEELYPSLFEVGQFQDAIVGDTTDEEKTKNVEVSFTPVVSNVVEYVDKKQDVVTTNSSSSRGRGVQLRTAAPTSQDCHYAVFLPVEMDDEEKQTVSASVYSVMSGRGVHPELYIFQYYELKATYVTRYGYADNYLSANKKYSESQRDSYTNSRRRTSALNQNGITNRDALKPIAAYDEDPLESYDAGFMLGIMRGPGNEAGVDVVNENYDNNGNAQWAQVSALPAFTADSIDQYGNDFDYNGQGEGGVSGEGRFSLKLQVEKRSKVQTMSIENNSAWVRTKKEAEYWIAYLFSPEQEQNLFTFAPRKMTDVQNAGWDVTGFTDEYTAFYPVLRTIVVGEYQYTVLLNAIMHDGTILTPQEIQEYIDDQGGSRAPAAVNDSLGILIKDDATEKDGTDLYALMQLFYMPDTAQPYLLTGLPETATTNFYPINSSAAHRGLLHKFNYEYFKFLVESRVAVITTTMTVQELRELDMMEWHTFGTYTGLIEKTSYRVTDNGLSTVIIHLRYL